MVDATKLLAGMNNMNSTLKDAINENGEPSPRVDSDGGDSKSSNRSDWKQPRQRIDNWKEESKKARNKVVELIETTKRRNALLRENKKTT